MKKTLFVLIIMIALFSSKSAFALSKDEIVINIQKIYDNATDYSAEFFQESELGSIKRVQKALGEVYFKKNGRMCWEYKNPIPQKIISNGAVMWIYQPDMNQVQQFDYKSLEMSSTANSFLNGIGKLMKDFDIKLLAESIEGYLVLDLKAKEDMPGVASVQMHVNPDNYNIIKTITTDAYGNKNSITFKNIKFNTGVEDDFFEFKAPEGVQVVTPPKAQ